MNQNDLYAPKNTPLIMGQSSVVSQDETGYESLMREIEDLKERVSLLEAQEPRRGSISDFFQRMFENSGKSRRG